MDLIMFVASAVLFFLLTPGIILSLPPHGSKITVAITHAIVFGAIWTFAHRMLMGLASSM